MEHLAILSVKLKLFDKILSGEKTIESRWFVNRKTPYKNIFSGEVIYFKEGGRFAKAVVADAKFFELTDDKKRKEILLKYGSKLGVGIEFLERIKTKRYCTLVYIKDVKEIEPFDVPYSTRSAWLTREKFQ